MFENNVNDNRLSYVRENYESRNVENDVSVMTWHEGITLATAILVLCGSNGM